jgi:hypothetical protein
MSHETSETVKKNGKWVNVYGRGNKKAGQRLPQDHTGLGHREYDDVNSAVKEAKERSERAIPHEHKRSTPAGGERNIDAEREDD